MVAALAAPMVAKANTTTFSVGYYIPEESQIRHPARMEWIAPANMVGMCLEPLVRIGGENRLEFVLAESIMGNDLGMTWTITVKQGVRWSGEESLSAEHVAANIRNWMADPQSSLGNQLRESVADVQVQGMNVVVLLKKPDFQFLYVLTNYTALIMHPDDDWVFSAQARRTGPFRLVTYEPMKRAIFAPDENHWNEATRAQFPVEFVHESGAYDQAFDVYPQTNPDQGQELIKRGLLVRQNNLADALAIHAKCREGVLAEAEVRHALRLCMSPSEMVASLGGYGQAGDHTHCSPIHADYSGGGLVSPIFDLEKSRRILAGSQIEVPLHYPAENIWQRNAVEAYARQAESAGARIMPTPIPRDQFDAQWDQFPGLTAIKWNHRPLAQQLYQLVYHSKAQWNLSGWEDEEFDRLTGSLAETPLWDLQGVAKRMNRARSILVERGPMIQAAWLDCNKAYNPNRVARDSVVVGSGGHIYANLLRAA
jgi:peptide/nickel transport system substrate-binding protein